MSLDEIEQLFFTRVPVQRLSTEIVSIYEDSKEGTEKRARAALLRGIDCRRNDREASKRYYEEAEAIAHTHDLPRIFSGCFQYRAETSFTLGDLHAANRLNESARSFALAADFKYGLCEAEFLSGRIAFRYGSLDDGINHLKEALGIAQRYGFLKRQVEVLSYLSESFTTSQHVASGEAYAKEALRIARELEWKTQIPKLIIRFATVELELSHYAEVSNLVSEVRNTLPKENHSLWAATHTLTGKVHEAEHRYGQAEEEFYTALSLADYPNAERERSNIHSHLAELYLTTKRPALALEEGLAGLADAEKAQDMYTRKDALARIHAAYKALGKYKQAHEYLERYNTLIAESDTQLLKSRLEYHALKSDYEVERAKSETTAKESEVLRLQLEHKERELAEKVRGLLKQAETLREFRKDLHALLHRASADDPAVKEIRARLAAFPEPELNWQEFEQQFAEAHPEFLPRLGERFPDLTQMEMRVAAMVQMDLKSSDIAQLFSVTERAVEFHRLNLRKKLRLRKGEDLRRFLAALPATG